MQPSVSVPRASIQRKVNIDASRLLIYQKDENNKIDRGNLCHLRAFTKSEKFPRVGFFLIIGILRFNTVELHFFSPSLLLFASKYISFHILYH